MKKLILKILYFILKTLAKVYLYRTKPFVVWVTWSVWKTSCRMIVSKILSDNLKEKKVYTSPKNFNSEIGLVLSIFSIEKFRVSFKYLIILIFNLSIKSLFTKKKYDILVLEYGIDKPLDMEYLISIVQPDISIFTKLDSIHAENFPDLKKWILKEKIKLSKSSKYKSYINCSDSDLQNEYDKLKWNKGCFYDISDFEYKMDSEKLYSEFKSGDIKVKTNMLWSENFSYITLSFEILKDLWVFVDSKEVFLELKNQKWRFWVMQWIKDSVIIDSSYNAWPESMKKMIENTFNISDKLSNHKILFVVWDMRELWDYSEQKHKEIARILKDKEVLTVWEKFKKYCDFENFKNSRLLWKYLKDYLEKSDDKYIILFKWSQNTIFLEEAIKEVLKDKNDILKLVRQDEIFMNKKERFFGN